MGSAARAPRFEKIVALASAEVISSRAGHWGLGVKSKGRVAQSVGVVTLHGEQVDR
jgi:hypothetical protein